MHGQYTIGKDEVMHPFDADGMIAAFSFNNGSALFRNRFVRTAGFQNERRRRRILYRGAFGTQIPGGVLANIFRTKLKNPANTNVIYYAKRLLALWESGNPYRLEEDSLRTIGKYTFKGVLQTDEPYTAHPKVDPKTGNLVGFSYNPTPEKTTLKITELNPDLDVVYQRSIDVPGFGLFHDMAVTENYYLFIQGSFDFDPLPFVLGQKVSSKIRRSRCCYEAKYSVLTSCFDGIGSRRVYEVQNRCQSTFASRSAGCAVVRSESDRAGLSFQLSHRKRLRNC